jgi:hypothetical protein
MIKGHGSEVIVAGGAHFDGAKRRKIFMVLKFRTWSKDMVKY